MKYLFLLLLAPVCSRGQFTNLEKYWIYRERLNNFWVSGSCQGCGQLLN